MNYKYHYTQKTDIGKVYKVNQDSIYSRTFNEIDKFSLGLFAVADGIGGHKAGEIASQIAIETIDSELNRILEKNKISNDINELLKNDNENIINKLASLMSSAIELANKNIIEYSLSNEEEAGNLGSTITCAIIINNIAVIGNVGDSRAYLLSNSYLDKITNDHSYVETLVTKGIESSDAYYTHPYRNIITRSLGHSPEIEVDTFFRYLSDGDRLLLCSDGLWEVLGNEEILNDFINMKDLEQSGTLMIEEANNNGGKDNISLVMIDFLSEK